MKLLYCYIAFAYGYGLYIMGEIHDEISYEYRYDINNYRKALFHNILIFLIFPIIWPFVIIYGWINDLKDIIKR